MTLVTKGIDRERFQVSVCILDGEGPVADHLRSLGATVTTIGRGPFAAARFFSVVRASRPDILHANTGGRLFRRIAWIAGTRRSIVHLHGPGWNWAALRASDPLRLRALLIASTANATRRIVCAEWMAKFFTDVVGKGAEVSAIQYGIDLPGQRSRDDARRELGLPGDKVVVGYTGRLSHEKGVADLCGIFSDVASRRPECAFVAIGDGPMMSDLAALRTRVGMERLALPGFRLDAVQLLSAIDVVVMPSHREGLSLSHLEAMGAGRAIVGYDVEGLIESGRNGVTGFYVPRLDTHAAADAVIALVDDAPMRERFGLEARRIVSTHFTIERMTREVESLYSSLV